jgi:hypothetical protein
MRKNKSDREDYAPGGWKIECGILISLPQDNSG